MPASTFYIMNAKCLFDDAKTNIEGVLNAWGVQEQTILVCRRATTGTNSQPIFVSGAGVGYFPKDTVLPHRSHYTEDTGEGHRNLDKGLIIENIIDVVDGRLKPRNMVGINETRWAWTMK